MKNSCKRDSFIKSWAIIVALVASLYGCGYGPQSRPESNDWIEFSTLVDGVIEIDVSFPRPKDERWMTRSGFVGSETNKLTEILMVGYDQGRGKLSGAYLVHFFGAVLNIEFEDSKGSPITFDDIMNVVYLSRPEKAGQYEIVGKEFIDKNEWVRVNFTGRQAAEGVAYYKPISDSYALLISMSMFGEGSDNTKLYQQRYQDLLKVLGTVNVTIADFAIQKTESQQQ